MSQTQPNGASHGAAKGDHDAATSKPRTSLRSKAKAAWAWTKLDVPTMTVMFKGAIAPTICLAAQQSESFAFEYTTTGYLVAIVSILALPVLPRAKFLKHALACTLGIGVAMAANLLAIYCSVKARKKHSGQHLDTLDGPSPPTYDSNAAAVAGVFLFFYTWVNNVMRSKFPQYTAPGILPAILTNVALIYTPQFSTMDQGISLIERITKSQLTGLAISFGVSLLIFPRNTRFIVFKEITGYLMIMRKLTKANNEYIQSLETGDMFSRTPTGAPDRPLRKEAKSIKGIMAELTGLHAKLTMDLPFAKREMAYGRLGSDDLSEIMKRLRILLFMFTGLSSMNDIFERSAEVRGWASEIISDETPLDKITDPVQKQHARAVSDWHQIAGMLKGPFQDFSVHVDGALMHILIVLRLIKAPPKKPDLEGSGASPRPGDSAFTDHLAERVTEFRARKSQLLERFTKSRGVDLPPGFFDDVAIDKIETPSWGTVFLEKDNKERYRRQLYLILWMQYLFESLGSRLVEFCQWVDSKKASGKLDRKHLIFPPYKHARRYYNDFFSTKHDAHQDETAALIDQTPQIDLGASYYKRRDPEHLPPKNTIEKLGDYARTVPHFLRSREAVFGLRAAIATICVAIISLVAPSRTFAIEHRVYWAQIMIAIGMNPSTAQSLFGFILRIGGTTLAMGSSLAIWYMVDGKVPGVIVLYWFVLLFPFYFLIKYPQYIPAILIFAVTNTLIIGYELQAVKLGIKLTTSNGQNYYPTSLLAPYRFITVVGGLALAWIWTVFPYPIAAHSDLRRDLGKTLLLLANYNSITDETVKLRIRGVDDINDPNSPFHELTKARHKVFAKSMTMLQALRMHTKFVKFDLPIGGRFPKEIYMRIMERVRSMVNFMSLMMLASQTFAETCEKDLNTPNAKLTSETAWMADLRRLIEGSDTINKETTKVLSMLSAGVVSGTPLPPYITCPEPYALATKLDAMDSNILSIKHFAEPGYTAFACLQLGTKSISDDMAALLRDVKELVGEMDFGFHQVTSREKKEDSESDVTPMKEVKNE